MDKMGKRCVEADGVAGIPPETFVGSAGWVTAEGIQRQTLHPGFLDADGVGHRPAAGLEVHAFPAEEADGKAAGHEGLVFCCSAWRSSV